MSDHSIVFIPDADGKKAADSGRLHGDVAISLP